jgi:hypothetical protein
MKFTTLIPTHLNDGTPVAEAALQEIVTRLAVLFGGVSTSGPVSGIWFDGDVQHDDETIMVWCVCEIDRYNEARDAVIEIGRELGQKAMYFEVRDFDGVQIIEIPD